MTAPGGDPTRVVGRRCVAYVVDVFLVVLILLALFVAPGDVRKTAEGCPRPVPGGHSCFQFKTTGYLVADRAIFGFVGTAVLLVIVLFIVPQAVAGASPGKLVMGIRVVRPDGQAPGLARSIVRSIVRSIAWVVDGIALLLPVALWLAILTPGHRRCGDFLAGTFVVPSAARGHRVPTPHRSMHWPWPEPKQRVSA
jgi:uncharacterized RDD family membrane protein YckC